MLNWSSGHNDLIDWTIRQLDLEPYQHILEVGCGSGRLLTAVATHSDRNFIAAIEPSLTRYQQAVRRTRHFIRQETMQLHHGYLSDLPYPTSYFHTIYGLGSYYSWNNLITECLRLSQLLRAGGRLILLSQPGRYKKEEDLRTEAARLQAAFLKAGLTDIHTGYRPFPRGLSLAVTGVKPSSESSQYNSLVIKKQYPLTIAY